MRELTVSEYRKSKFLVLFPHEVRVHHTSLQGRPSAFDRHSKAIVEAPVLYEETFSIQNWETMSVSNREAVTSATPSTTAYNNTSL